MVSSQQDAKRTRVNDPEPMGPIHAAGAVMQVSDSMASQTPIDPHSLSVPMPTDDENNLTMSESVAMDISEGDQTAMEDNRTEHGVTAMETESSMDHSATAEEKDEEEEEVEDIPKDNLMTFPEISSTNGLNIESLVSFFLFLWSVWGRLTCVVSGTTGCCVQETSRGLTTVDGVHWKTPTST